MAYTGGFRGRQQPFGTAGNMPIGSGLMAKPPDTLRPYTPPPIRSLIGNRYGARPNIQTAPVGTSTYTTQAPATPSIGGGGTPAPSTSGGFSSPNVGWVSQPDGSLRAMGTGGGMSPARDPATSGMPNQNNQPLGNMLDVGVGNMRWDGTQFIGFNNAPVNPILLQTYAPQLRQRGWNMNGRNYTPPPGFVPQYGEGGNWGPGNNPNNRNTMGRGMA